MSEATSTPTIRYSKEYKETAVEMGRPVFTLDIYYPKGTKPTHAIKRMTVTGVLRTDEIDHAIRQLEKNR